MEYGLSTDAGRDSFMRRDGGHPVAANGEGETFASAPKVLVHCVPPNHPEISHKPFSMAGTWREILAEVPVFSHLKPRSFTKICFSPAPFFQRPPSFAFLDRMGCEQIIRLHMDGWVITA